MCDVAAVNEVLKQAEQARRWRARPESWWWIAAVVLVPVAVLTGLAALVLITTTHPTEAGDRIDLVKTALSVGAGTGGVVALVLAGRRQWHAEQAQRGSEHDATERRITDLYTKAADQLGSDKAPVRLAGLYALERLAQNNPDQRQTIVNVLCAYLRMPYTPPRDDVQSHRIVDVRPVAPRQRRLTPGGGLRMTERTQPTGSEDDIRQEREVRITAQRILRTHLKTGPGRGQPVNTFWPNTDLDLTGATLIDFEIDQCHVATASFAGAQFTGTARFAGAQFTDDASFDGAQFKSAVFAGAQFTDDASFVGAQFTDTVMFVGAQFTNNALFAGAQFTEIALFDRAQFTGWARFDDTQFTGTARFDKAQFTGRTRFDRAQFTNGARFHGAQFTNGARFDDTQFTDTGSFTSDDEPSWVRVDVSDDVAKQRAWPAGWVVVDTTARPHDHSDGKWGLLTHQPGQ
jgi:uncharacterized protein YjbI with pentapeptide repeats